MTPFGIRRWVRRKPCSWCIINARILPSDELKTTAIELQDLVQTKVGTTKFAHIYNQIRQSVLGLRRERKVARVLQASTNPEAAARRKIQRNVIKKDSRKRKDRGFLCVTFVIFFVA